MMRRISTLILLYFFLSLYLAKAQFGSSLLVGIDIYQKYKNPAILGNTTGRTSGTVLPLIIGFKEQLGNGNFGISLEAQINFAPFAIDVQEFKGLGAMSIPLMIKFNSGALTGFSQKLSGFALGGGLQYSRTELFGLNDKFHNLNRDFFRTYIAEFNFGVGLSGLEAIYYLRLGFGNLHSRSFNTGILLGLDFFRKNERNIVQSPLRI